jgi:hypothetical protein
MTGADIIVQAVLALPLIAMVLVPSRTRRRA